MTDNVHALKHENIAQALAREIRTGKLKRGSRLPGEHALAARFSVSRNTIRSALTELSREGLISTRSGKGSFVTFDGRPLDDRLGWARALAAQGVATETRTLRLEKVEDPELAGRLGLASSSFFAVDRVRTVTDGPAVSLERSRIPAAGDLLDLPARGLLDGSLTATLASAGLHADHGDEWVTAAPLDETDAAELGRSPGEWFLRARRVSWTASGELVEHVESRLDPLRFELHLRFGSTS
ncbi:GntR family transcriptional regulator [Actinoallomurus iriomotensis]|uniref:GntR family transcriptional regulator n=1 Tax=Actinoallomurus iriomotensis TaxID=478107 RepID=A0A9W6VMS9_9ACTN|nr:GntR family transcriptional regulator [Actinoallomurus iriomotensis]GLY73029.1 GntR family transcriptional regulator [Actinoallomurus iriomotensis]